MAINNTMANNSSAFRARGVFGKNLTGGQRAMNKYMNLQQAHSMTAMSMSKGIQRGARAAGYTGNKLREAVRGVNSGMVSPEMRGMAHGANANTSMGRFGSMVNHRSVIGGPGFSGMASKVGSALLRGAVGMMGIAVMKGGMSQAHDIMMERYMRDSRYSSRLLTQTNLGSASGNSVLSIGNHAGLSLALSRTRHGH